MCICNCGVHDFVENPTQSFLKKFLSKFLKNYKKIEKNDF